MPTVVTWDELVNAVVNNTDDGVGASSGTGVDVGNGVAAGSGVLVTIGTSVGVGSGVSIAVSSVWASSAPPDAMLSLPPHAAARSASARITANMWAIRRMSDSENQGTR